MRFFSVMMVFCLLLAMLPQVIAQENTIDDETLEEVELIAESNTGAQVRMMQLTRAITKAHVSGQEITELVQDEDAAELESILAQIEDIKAEAQSVDYQNDDVAGLYISMKNEMKELTKQFREKVSGKLSSQQMQQVQNAVQNSEEINQLKEQVRNQIRNVNAQRVQNMLSGMGKSDNEMVEKVRNSEMTKEQVKEQLMTHWNSLNQENKEAFRKQIGQRLQQRESLKEQLKTMMQSGKLGASKRDELKGLSEQEKDSLDQERGSGDAKKGGAQ